MQEILTYIVVAVALFFATSWAVRAMRRVSKAEKNAPSCDSCDGCQLHDICRDIDKKKDNI